MHQASVVSENGVEEPYEEDKAVTNDHGVGNSGPLGDGGSFFAGRKSPSLGNGSGVVSLQVDCRARGCGSSAVCSGSRDSCCDVSGGPRSRWALNLPPGVGAKQSWVVAVDEIAEDGQPDVD